MLIAEEGDEYPVLKSSRSEQNVARFWNIVQATMNTCIPYCNQFLNSNDYCEGGGGRGGGRNSRGVRAKNWKHVRKHFKLIAHVFNEMVISPSLRVCTVCGWIRVIGLCDQCNEVWYPQKITCWHYSLHNTFKGRTSTVCTVKLNIRKLHFAHRVY